MQIVNTIPVVADEEDKDITDLFVCVAIVRVGERLPDGDWRVLSGNNDYSTIARVVMRHELEQ